MVRVFHWPHLTSLAFWSSHVFTGFHVLRSVLPFLDHMNIKSLGAPRLTRSKDATNGAPGLNHGHTLIPKVVNERTLFVFLPNHPTSDNIRPTFTVLFVEAGEGRNEPFASNCLSLSRFQSYNQLELLFGFAYSMFLQHELTQSMRRSRRVTHRRSWLLWRLPDAARSIAWRAAWHGAARRGTWQAGALAKAK